MLVLAGGNELSSQDTRQRMALLLKQMQGSVPPQVRHLELLVAKLVTRTSVQAARWCTLLQTQATCDDADKPNQIMFCLQIFQDIVGKLKPRERKQLDSVMSG